MLIIDDTIEEKPHTDENDIICWHWDHSKSCNIKGVNILNVIVNYDGKYLPVGYEIIKKDKKIIDQKTGKPRRKSTRTKNEMLRDIFDIQITNNLVFQYVAWDIWFSSKENMQHVKRNGKDFISAIKNNRLVATSMANKLAGKFVNITSLNLDEKSTKEVYIQGLRFPVLLCKQVFINENGSQGILYLACSDMDLNFTQVIEIYQKRWSVEVYHKSLKQNNSIAKSPTKTVKTQSNHIFMSIYSFCKMQVLAFQHNTNQFAIKTKMMINANKMLMQELMNIKANSTNLSTA